jgi:hypothetical protein
VARRSRVDGGIACLSTPPSRHLNQPAITYNTHMASFRSWLRVFFLLDKRPSRFVKHLRRARKWRAKHPGTPCHTCGYDIGKDHSLATCPECGNAINWNPEWYEDGYLQKRGIVVSGLLFQFINMACMVIMYLPGIILVQRGYLVFGAIITLVNMAIILYTSIKLQKTHELLCFTDPTVYTRKYKNYKTRKRHYIKILSLATIVFIAGVLAIGILLNKTII